MLEMLQDAGCYGSRRFSVAPMMDWTAAVEIAQESGPGSTEGARYRSTTSTSCGRRRPDRISRILASVFRWARTITRAGRIASASA